MCSSVIYVTIFYKLYVLYVIRRHRSDIINILSSCYRAFRFQKNKTLIPDFGTRVNPAVPPKLPYKYDLSAIHIYVCAFVNTVLSASVLLGRIIMPFGLPSEVHSSDCNVPPCTKQRLSVTPEKSDYYSSSTVYAHIIHAFFAFVKTFLIKKQLKHRCMQSI